MTRSNHITTEGPSPRTVPLAYYVDWIRDLRELNRSGAVTDEDYAYQRADRLAQLMYRPLRQWLAWLYLGVPAGVIAAAVSWRLLGNAKLSLSLAGVAVLSILAAIGRRARERHIYLTDAERLMLLRSMLADDTITAEEFSEMETRLMTGPNG